MIFSLAIESMQTPELELKIFKCSTPGVGGRGPDGGKKKHTFSNIKDEQSSFSGIATNASKQALKQVGHSINRRKERTKN